MARRFSCTSRIRPPATSPRRSTQLVEGIEDGLSFQTLLGVTGSGKTFTMANVIARMGRPAIVFAPNKTLAAQLYAEFREFFPQQRGRVFRLATTTTTSRKPTCRSATCSSKRTRRSTSTSSRCACPPPRALLERRDVVIVATVSAIYGIGNPSEYHKMILTLRVERQARPARRHRAPDRRCSTPATKSTFSAARSACAATRSTSSRRSTPELAVRVELFDDEIESLQLFDPLTGRVRQKIPRFTVYPVVALRDAARHRAARDRNHQGGIARAARILPQGGQAGRGAAPRAAHALRPGNAAGNRFLQGHRELFAPPVRRARRASRRRRWSITCRTTR